MVTSSERGDGRPVAAGEVHRAGAWYSTVDSAKNEK
jgi:hypothetical protein